MWDLNIYMCRAARRWPKTSSDLSPSTNRRWPWLRTVSNRWRHHISIHPAQKGTLSFSRVTSAKPHATQEVYPRGMKTAYLLDIPLGMYLYLLGCCTPRGIRYPRGMDTRLWPKRYQMHSKTYTQEVCTCNPRHITRHPRCLHQIDTCKRYEMHPKRYGKWGPFMGSYVLDNTLYLLGICLGVQGICLGVHYFLIQHTSWSALTLPKRYGRVPKGYENAPKRYAKCNPRGIGIPLG